MKKKAIFSTTIIIILVIISTIGYIYYTNENSFTNITTKDVKSITLVPFYGAGTNLYSPYIYNKELPEDMKVINGIIKGLNTGKSVEVITKAISYNGGTPEYLTINLVNGKSIEILRVSGSEDQVFVSYSGKIKTYRFYSPGLGKLFTDEINRLFTSKQRVPSSN